MCALMSCTIGSIIKHLYAVLINFVILSLFAFVNAQVCIVGVEPSAVIDDPIVVGIFFGALLGKPIGVIGMITVLVKTGFLKLSAHMAWQQMTVVGLLSGVGFTTPILTRSCALRSRHS